MAYKKASFDTRIHENIKNYDLDHLFEVGTISSYFSKLAKSLGIGLVLTDRQGEKIVSAGTVEIQDFFVDEDPGRKVRIENRTVGHLYSFTDQVSEEKLALIEEMLDDLVTLLETMGKQTYLYKESSIYVDELETKIAEDERRRIRGEKEDPLTGVYNKAYFMKRMDIVERSEVIPVAIVSTNINDWAFANDHFGDEGSDRLIRIVAGFLKEEAKPEYIIGRVEGDSFLTLVPMAEEGEAEDYAARVQARCLSFEDSQLAPSVACGIVFRTNVEESMNDLLSDCEYEMLNNKLEIKSAPGYRERMESKI